MRLLITGSNGLLGSNLVRFFQGRGVYDVFTTSRHPSYLPELKNFTRGDLLDAAFVNQVISTVKPDIIINTVGPASVDKCEREPEFAYMLTVQTAENVAQSAQRYETRLIYISTDHLFDGRQSMYLEDDEPAPVNVYGKMKLQAEAKTLAVHPNTVITRTNFYGWSPRHHPTTFGEWVYDSLKQPIPINLFTDYYFTPLEVTHLAGALEIVANSELTGVINIAGCQRCSKYDFGIALAKVFGLDPSPICPGTINAVSFKAKRQRDLSLSTEKFKRIFNQNLPDLQEGLQRFCENIKVKP